MFLQLKSTKLYFAFLTVLPRSKKNAQTHKSRFDFFLFVMVQKNNKKELFLEYQRENWLCRHCVSEVTELRRKKERENAVFFVCVLSFFAICASL